MTTPGLRHKALPPLLPFSGQATVPNSAEGIDALDLAAATRLKHSRARAGSVGVDGPLGFDIDEEEEDGGEDDRRIDSSDVVGGDFALSESSTLGLRRRATVRT